MAIADLRVGASPAIVGIAVAAGIAALVIVGFTERRRPPEQRTARLVLSSVAVGALVLLLLRLEHRQGASRDLAVIVTRGASLAEIQAARDSLHPTVTAALDGVPGAEARAMALLRAEHPAVTRAHVLGAGPDPATWPTLDGMQVTAAPSVATAGIAGVSVAARGEVGAPLTIAGRIAPDGTRPTTVRLGAPDGHRDSVLVAPGSAAFAFTTRPRAAGTWTWSLDVAGLTGSEDSVHVQVVPHRPVGVLLLTGAPSFEVNALRRWLEQRGERIVVRTQVSQSKYVSEYVNGPGTGIPQIDAARLAGIQLLVADPEAIVTLSTGERAALRTAIRDQGLGLLMLGTSEAANAALRPMIVPAVPAAGTTDEQLARPRVAGGENASRTQVPLAPGTIAARDGDSVLVRDASGAPLAAARPAGRGMVGVTTIAASTRWLLAGEQQAFDDYWAVLTSSVTGPDPAGEPWAIEGRYPPRVDAPTLLTRLGADTVRTVVITSPTGAPDTLRAQPAPDDGKRRMARWWPREAGWHRVTSPAGDVRIHVDGPASATPRSAALRREALDEQVAAADAAPIDAGAPSAPWAPVTPTWFLVLFVASTGGLWALERWGSRT